MSTRSNLLHTVLVAACSTAVAAGAWHFGQGARTSHDPANAPEEVSTLSAAMVAPVHGALEAAAWRPIPSGPRHPQASESDQAERSRNLDHVQQLQRARSSAKNLLGLVMNSVADVLESEGQRVPLQRGIGVRPGEIDQAEEKAIVRQGPGGAFLLIAERERFPLLFELADAAQRKASVSEEQWQAALDLARAADLASGRQK